MLSKYGMSSVTVSSVAVPRTSVCHWASKSSKTLRDAVTKSGASHVWFSAGGNDAEDEERVTCIRRCMATGAGSVFEGCYEACEAALVPKIIGCASKLFDALWKKHPDVKVLNFFYDISCYEGWCLPSFRAPHCGKNITCNNVGHVFFQKKYSDALSE